MKTYTITKIDLNGNKRDYGGGYTLDDVKAITKGYKKDSTISNLYMRRGSRSFYVVDEEAERSKK